MCSEPRFGTSRGFFVVAASLLRSVMVETARRRKYIVHNPIFARALLSLTARADYNRGTPRGPTFGIVVSGGMQNACRGIRH